MCQGSVPEYFVFKDSPPKLPPGWLSSRFLVESPKEDSREYVVSSAAPCPIIDAHVHVFPQKLMDAVWTFFDNFYWPVHYKEAYAHKNGIARDLNKFLARTVHDMNQRYASAHDVGSRQRRRVATGLATVMPGEPGAKEILAEAFTTLGLSGIKMHSHVQCVPANHPTMDEVYETCIRFQKPVLIHAGKEPNSAAYKVDADKICDASIIEDVLKKFPDLRICVPHLGMNQYEEFFDLLDKYPNLYLDTTMTFGAFFQSMDDSKPMALMIRTMLLKHSNRVLYGTDWPNIPYEWCRELANLVSLVDGDGEATKMRAEEVPAGEKGRNRTVEGDQALERILWRNATNRTYTIGGITLTPFTSGQPLWYYVAAVSVLAAAVGVFGMFSALAANRRLVKAFEAFYVLSLLTQFGLIAWALIWCKQRQTDFDTVCSASKDGLVRLPVPWFASSWDCQKIFTVAMITIAVGGVIWIGFNFYLTNRVIHYARELFAEKANRYKVLGEAAAKELDREQQIPLNYTNVHRPNEQEGFQNSHTEQPSYRDEIEYKNPRGDDDYQHSRAAAAAGFASYGQGVAPEPYQQQHQHPVAPGFAHRDSAQGLDLVNPYYAEQETIAAPHIAMETPQTQMHASSAPYVAQGSGQSFVHTSTNKIASPFDDDEPVVPVASLPQDDIKVPLPPSPVEDGVQSLTVSAPEYARSPPSSNQLPDHSNGSGSGSGNGSGKGEPYQF
ncbi:hypothetical protein BGX28_008310 [Mortierella sp. GBA30]|nr:hypothetical protein BGX28_008310 [Mortierella sp. GBA30]